MKHGHISLRCLYAQRNIFCNLDEKNEKKTCIPTLLTMQTPSNKLHLLIFACTHKHMHMYILYTHISILNAV